MKIGSDEHKRRFCDAFIASHNPYAPELLSWPELDDGALEALRPDLYRTFADFG